MCLIGSDVEEILSDVRAVSTIAALRLIAEDLPEDRRLGMV